ncbi:staygreen family protein [[Clostridium] polysaccharolyticum]|jgi:hypothetical protein|uniref:Staygreen protein n=1 Tax=[Clostridium] polysaccharolyticum TaxID=29364 RepID=A0A1I0E705_9FIRM|nr:staygreen family protein [[Clostridium] polysaccharolyticum]SET40972.1 Staygreen protein [[Clostridium] polysaccharolyticum]
MEKINYEAVKTEFRDRISPISPIIGRKYTITHSDETAQYFITIGRHYADDKMNVMRDEVLLTYENTEAGMVLMGEVLIDGEGVIGNADGRNEIFLREIPKALQAICYGDSRLFQANPELAKLPILIWFKSDNPKLNKLYDFGTMEEYC